jgi:hypothetical protein
VQLYRKLYQIAWQPRMADTGHHGLHLTSGAEGFVAQYVAPFVASPRWDEEVVARVLDRDVAPAADATRKPAGPSSRPVTGKTNIPPPPTREAMLSTSGPTPALAPTH